jgi:exopolyphosphatase/guanosine-5'-triphosphate,3'-diphosphate pyrophosphatase
VKYPALKDRVSGDLMNKKNLNLKKLGIIFFIILATSTSLYWKSGNERAPTMTRAAVDVGSGGLKVTIAKVDPQAQKIQKILYAKEYSVPLKRDMQVGGHSEFSEKIQKVALDTLAGLQKELSSYKPTEWKGIATAASRQATNAQEMYDKIEQELGLKISIISQTEEGRLGFATAAATTKVPQDKLIAFDSGAGSFQLTTLLNGELEVVEGELGHIPSLELLMEIRGEKLDLNSPLQPISFEEADLLVQKLEERLPAMSNAFKEKLLDPTATVVGIGNENFIFAMGAEAVGKNTYTKLELEQAIEAQLHHKAKKQMPSGRVLGMILLYSIMDGMGIDQLTYSYANGSCEGLLVDAKYWTEAPDSSKKA